MKKSELRELIIKKARAQRHSARLKLDAIGVRGLADMVNKSSVDKVSIELGISKPTIYSYLNTRGARRKIQYVLEDEKGA